MINIKSLPLRGALAPCVFSLSSFFVEEVIWSLVDRILGLVLCETHWSSPGDP